MANESSRADGDQGARLGPELRHAAEQRKSDVGKYLRHIADAIHSGAEDLRKKEHRLSADCVEQAARSLADVSDDFTNRDMSELTRLLGDMARRQPILTAALGFAAGFTLVRLARSAGSSDDDVTAQTRREVSP